MSTYHYQCHSNCDFDHAADAAKCLIFHYASEHIFWVKDSILFPSLDMEGVAICHATKLVRVLKAADSVPALLIFPAANLLWIAGSRIVRSTLAPQFGTKLLANRGELSMPRKLLLDLSWQNTNNPIDKKEYQTLIHFTWTWAQVGCFATSEPYRISRMSI